MHQQSFGQIANAYEVEGTKTTSMKLIWENAITIGELAQKKFALLVTSKAITYHGQIVSDTMSIKTDGF